jgi:hypothetical protein
VVLEPPRPVGGLPHVLLGQHLEDVLDVLDADRVAHPDLLGLVDRDLEGELAVSHPEDEEVDLLAVKVGPDLGGFDDSGPVVGVHHPISDAKRHAQLLSVMGHPV